MTTTTLQPRIEALTFYLDTPKSVSMEGMQNAAVIAVQYGEPGYWPVPDAVDAGTLNEGNNWSTEELEAAFNGSMFGWSTPSARPAVDAIRRKLDGDAIDQLADALGLVEVKP